MSLERPIVIFGTGRGGTSIFHTVMANHPRVSWISRAVNQKPERPSRGRAVMRALDLPGLSRAVRGTFPPIEGYRFWDHISAGFSEAERDLTADDLPDDGGRRIREALGQISTRKRPRLLLKITGWPRVGFLQAALSHARFVHVKRDGRAVANSFLNVKFWRGWEGPDGWRWGALSPEHEEIWETNHRSPVALAGIQWRIHMAAAHAAMAAAPEGTTHEISYEELCADPIATCRRVADFCELEWTPRFERTIRETRLHNTNHKWTRDLARTDREILLRVLEPALLRYGYDPEETPQAQDPSARRS